MRTLVSNHYHYH